jgi:hypothetical protein
MDENPYKAPRASTETNARRLAPLWRRIVAIPLIVIGGGFLILIVPFYALTATRRTLNGITAFDVTMIALIFGFFAAMLWVGIRLRRKKS